MRTLRYLVPAALLMSALLVACGGDSESAADEPTPRTTATARATEPAAAPTATPQRVPSAEPTPEPSPSDAPAPTQPAPQPTQTAPPPAPTNTPAPPPLPTMQAQYLTIAAKGSVFAQKQLFATAGGTISVTLDNQDTIAHDLIVYTPAGGIAAQTSTIVGPAQQTTSFIPSGAGNYFFKCSLHPLSMTGAIVVQ